MSDCPIDHRDPVPDWIDAVADRFEAAWQTVKAPSIAAFVGNETGERRAALLMELIQVDLACRAKIGDRRKLADYGDEFPEVLQRLGTDIAQPTPWPQQLLAQQAVTDRPPIAGYENLGKLGEGGMGVVYKARHARLGRVVALKMIRAGAKARRRDLTRFKTEMEAVARLQHPNIVQLYEVGEHDGQPYCALEYLDGGNLAEKLAGTPWRARQAAQLIETLARAIHAAHQQNVIHRDLKPANVLLGIDGIPKISDFGLAKQLTGVSPEQVAEALLEPSASLTQTGEIVGSPSYMAPEQTQGKPNEVGAPADIYGLGAILYELLTGRPPFKGETMLDTLEQVRTQDPVPPTRLQPKLPRDLETICLKTLAKIPSQRYATAGDLADDLRRLLDGKPIQARSVSHAEKLWRWCRRNPFIAIPSAAALLLLVGFVSVLSVSAVLVWQANKGLSDSLERERQNSYYKSIALAEREWSANNLNRMKQLLDACPADLCDWEWRYLKRLPLQDSACLRHPASVLSAMFSPDGQWIASGGHDGQVRIWNAATGRERFSFPAHANHLRWVSFSPNGRRLATASWDETAKVWCLDPQRGASSVSLLYTLPHDSGVSYVSFSPDGERIATASKELKLWDAASGRELQTLEGRSCVVFSPDGQCLAYGGPDRTVRIWDSRSRQERFNLRGHTANVMSVMFSRDGRWLVSTSADQSTRADGETIIWDTQTGQQVRTLHGHTGWIHTAVFSPDGQRLATGGLDGIVKLWNPQNGQEVLSLRGHRGLIRSLRFSPDGTRLMSACDDRTVRLWDSRHLESETGQEYLTLSPHGGGLNSVALSPKGRWLASIAADGMMRVWEVKLGRDVESSLVYVTPDCGGKVAFSQNGQFIACGGGSPRFGPRTLGRGLLPSPRATSPWP
jgi:WD40 repeat protein/tRNA A-37 threonylcarbamoyl transferase component Bud32